jgi:hypothetical protein
VTPAAPPDAGWTPDAALLAARLVTAGATVLLLAAGLALARRGRAATLRRTRDALLLVLGLSGALGWWSYFAVPVLDVVHEHDGFHYFVGAKYFPELGYRGIYACTLVADEEAGAGGPPGARQDATRIRDLSTNELVRGADVRAEAEACRARFSPERWRAFTADVAWFRAQLPLDAWQAIRTDHGFNGSPVWLLAGGALTNAVDSAESGFLALARLDSVLLAAMWLGVVLAFGWRTACVAAVFWGTNGFAVFDWTGGSVLRQDWLAALVLGIAALRRGAPGLAGALLTVATLLRVFPGLAVAALALKAALHWAPEALRARSLRPPPGYGRFAAGCALALALLVPAATWRAGPEAWAGFAQNSRKLLATPLLNEMGLAPAVAYEPGTRARVMEDPQAPDPLARWKRAQHAQRAERAWLTAAVAALYLALLLRALPALPDWAAVALGTGAVAIATQLTCYYHVALVGLALLHARHAAAGVALCALAGVSQWIWSKNAFSDVPFVWMSAWEIAVVLGVTAFFAARPQPKSASIE